MKSKHIVALVLVLAGTNLFTYATTRYWTTEHVLSRERERVMAVVENRRAGEQHPGQTLETQIRLAVGMAGGMYYWWNDGLIYWGAGGLLAISGVLVAFLEPRKNDAT